MDRPLRPCEPCDLYVNHTRFNPFNPFNPFPNRFNMFIEQGFGIYVLDDYSVHLMPEVRQAFFKKCTFLLLLVVELPVMYRLMIQINDCHHHLKTLYRDLEMKLMLEQLEKDPTKIPSPSRNEMMSMLSEAW